MYHENCVINDVVLTVINDGNGSMCGMTYAQRCAAADTGIAEYRAAVKRYGERYYGKFQPAEDSHGGSGRWLREYTFIAADIVQAYYRNHAKECARLAKQ